MPQENNSSSTIISLFVDGTNLYAGQYELFGAKNYLDFGKFIEYIEKGIKKKFYTIYFYASYSRKSKKPTFKEKSYLKNEALFYRSVKDTKNVVFFTGYRSNTSGKEKEVDVKLTADIVSMAFLEQFSEAYLLTGDADFLQALFTIKKHHDKKKINLLCLENKIMYKGAFYFHSNIIYFNELSIKFHKNQKITLVKLEKEKVVNAIQ